MFIVNIGFNIKRFAIPDKLQSQRQLSEQKFQQHSHQPESTGIILWQCNLNCLNHCFIVSNIPR